MVKSGIFGLPKVSGRASEHFGVRIRIEHKEKIPLPLEFAPNQRSLVIRATPIVQAGSEMARGNLYLTKEQGARLLQLAAQRGISQTDLAARTKVDPSNLSKMLRNSASVTAQTRQRLELALELEDGSLCAWLDKDCGRLILAGWNDVVAWGWSFEKLLEILIDLDYETTPNLNVRRVGSPEQWAPIFKKLPASWAILVAPSREIVGYWAIVPLATAAYFKARAGMLDDSAIEADAVCSLDVPGNYLGYVSMICCREGYRHPGAPMLFRELFRRIESLADVGIFFEEICCNAYSDIGLSFCKQLELDHLGSHYDHGMMYRKVLLTDPRSTFLVRIPPLMRQYCARSEEIALIG